MKVKKIEIDLGGRSYPIIIGSDLLENIHQLVPFDLSTKKVFLVHDQNVENYAKVISQSIEAGGAEAIYSLSLPDGEQTKSFEHYERLQGWLLNHGISRDSVIFAVGGGVIGDLVGFAASTILRGVPYIQVPTTLLSQVDSAVGGKTGINTKFGKNLVGTFYQPAAVITDVECLKTLPERQMQAGYAEILKYGLIADAHFFEWLNQNGKKVLKCHRDEVVYAVETSCRAKAKIVEEDEKEKGQRALLNLGHTFGHALEAAAGFDGSLLHGEAVSIGMVMAFELSVKMDLCVQEDLERLKAHLTAHGLPINAANITTDADQLIRSMNQDKKVKNNKMTFILARGIGDAFITQEVEEASVRDILMQSLGEQ